MEDVLSGKNRMSRYSKLFTYVSTLLVILVLYLIKVVGASRECMKILFRIVQKETSKERVKEEEVFIEVAGKVVKESKEDLK